MKKISKKVILKNLSRANKMHSNRQPMSVMDLMKKYGGTHFFYAQLITAGKLVKENGKYVWSGGKLTKKTIKPILRSVAKHRKPINDRYIAAIRHPGNKRENLLPVKHKYIKRSAYWKQFKRVKEAQTMLITAMDTHIDKLKFTRPAIDLLIAGVEKEIQAHRSNGSNAEHLKNIALISADLMKLVQ